MKEDRQWWYSVYWSLTARGVMARVLRRTDTPGGLYFVILFLSMLLVAHSVIAAGLVIGIQTIVFTWMIFSRLHGVFGIPESQRRDLAVRAVLIARERRDVTGIGPPYYERVAVSPAERSSSERESTLVHVVRLLTNDTLCAVSHVWGLLGIAIMGHVGDNGGATWFFVLLALVALQFVGLAVAELAYRVLDRVLTCVASGTCTSCGYPVVDEGTMPLVRCPECGLDAPAHYGHAWRLGGSCNIAGGRKVADL